MSRGPGKLQQYVQEAVDSQATPLHANTLLWAWAERNGGGVSSYKSFKRAVRGLIDVGRLVVLYRRLDDLDDVVRFYPHQTKDPVVRQLRLALLPELTAFLKMSRYLEFTSAKQEAFVFKKMETEDFDRLAALWAKLKPDIFRSLAGTSPLKQNLGVAVISRAEELLGSQKTSHPEPLLDLLKQYVDTNPKDGPTSPFQKLLDGYATTVPESLRRQTRLKSQLYYAVNAKRDRQGHPRIKDEMRVRLTDKFEELETLGQIRQPLSGWPTGSNWQDLLDKLLLRDVFRQVEFISRP